MVELKKISNYSNGDYAEDLICRLILIQKYDKHINWLG